MSDLSDTKKDIMDELTRRRNRERENQGTAECLG